MPMAGHLSYETGYRLMTRGVPQHGIVPPTRPLIGRETM